MYDKKVLLKSVILFILIQFQIQHSSEKIQNYWTSRGLLQVNYRQVGLHY